MDKSLQKNSSKWDQLMFGFLPAKYFFPLAAVTLLGVALDASPKGFLGGFFVCTILGLILDKIGEITPVVNTYLGGGPIVTLFASAAIMYFDIIPQESAALITDFVKDMDYIGLVVGALICGSILTMDRKVLIRVGSVYLIPVLGGILLAFALTGLVGQLLGYGWQKAILFIALPIMGGGTSAGAVPTSAIYAGTLSQESGYYLAITMPAVIIGNALAILSAGLLNALGKKHPKWTGNGQLMKNQDQLLGEQAKTSSPLNFHDMGVGLLMTGAFYVVGILVSKLIPGIHYYGWTILACAACKIFGLIPEGLQQCISQWYRFLSAIAIPAVLFGIGYVYTDLAVVMENLTPTYFLLAVTTLMGAIVGPWFIGKLLGLYPIESAITGGLCMANMGGSGDIATLGAANRMELMPFAQISSRIGGAIILVLASILSALIGVPAGL